MKNKKKKIERERAGKEGKTFALAARKVNCKEWEERGTLALSLSLFHSLFEPVSVQSTES